MGTIIEIDSLIEDTDFFETIDRAKFEKMCAELFQLTIKIVKGVLNDAGLDSGDIDKIILVGGSTRIPKIQQLLQEQFPGKEICKTIDADEAVAYGAAVQAAIIHGGATENMKNMILMEVTPLSLGVAVSAGSHDLHTTYMIPIINRNTRIPVCRSRVFSTSCDDQTKIIFPIIQGEHYLASDNFQIGKFKIRGVPKAAARVEKGVVEFSIDANGILTVSAVSESNADAKAELTIKNVSGSLTKAEIEKMFAEAEEFRVQDREERTTRWQLEQRCNKTIQENGNKSDIKFKRIVEKCREALIWLESCRRPDNIQFIQRQNEILSLSFVVNTYDPI